MQHCAQAASILHAVRCWRAQPGRNNSNPNHAGTHAVMLTPTHARTRKHGPVSCVLVTTRDKLVCHALDDFLRDVRRVVHPRHPTKRGGAHQPVIARLTAADERCTAEQRSHKHLVRSGRHVKMFLLMATVASTTQGGLRMWFGGMERRRTFYHVKGRWVGSEKPKIHIDTP